MFHLVTSGPCWIEVEAWSSPETDWLQGTLRFMAAEASELRPGGETVITRLADILVIQAIRSWIAQDAAPQSGWLGALQDPQIGRAITLIHRGPARPWTVASLAAGVLAEHLAATWPGGRRPARNLARRLGYQSEAAFSRALKRFIEVPPGAARRAERISRSRRLRRDSHLRQNSPEPSRRTSITSDASARRGLPCSRPATGG